MSEMRIKSKVNGLVSMRGYWIKSLVVFIIIALLSFGISQLEMAYRNVFGINLFTDSGDFSYDYRSIIVEAVAAVVSIVVLSPLILGMFDWFYKITNGKEAKIGDLFSWYGSGKLFLKSLLLSIDIGIRTFLWGVLIYAVPTVLMVIGTSHYSGIGTDFSSLTLAQTQNLAIGSILIMFSAITGIGCTLLFLLVTTKYIPAYYLLVEDNSIKISKAVKNSVKYSKGYKWEYTKFVLSYIGWFLTCILIVPIFYVFPYFLSSLTIYTKSLIYSNRAKENNNSNSKDATIKFDTVEPSKNDSANL